MRALILIGLLSVAAVAAADPPVSHPADEGPFAPLEFLVGHWRGEGFGGVIEEIWLPAEGNAMHGVFRSTADGTMRFSEFLQVTIEDDELVLRFEHFRPDYTTWEGNGPVMELRLARATKNYVRFEGLNDETPAFMEYRRQGAVLVAMVAGVDTPLEFRRVESDG